MRGAYLHCPICLYGVNRDNSAFTFWKLGIFERKVLALAIRPVRAELLHFSELHT